MNQYMNDDIIMATVHLVDRCGASDFEIGYLHDDVPLEEAGWWAHAAFRGDRITVADQPSPTAAALALSQRLLTGATCRCRQPVTLTAHQPGCRWRLMGDRWEPGCDAPPIPVPKGSRGDYGALRAALEQPLNRADRRKKPKKKP